MLKLLIALSSMFLHNYFDESTKLFSDFHLAKFLNTSVKPFSSCKIQPQPYKVIFSIYFLYFSIICYSYISLILLIKLL